ncbi:MAG TPA: CaiB/BaiF CoA-transferase family protein, partial [Burkholderiaceae bacterium]|nr:CaiB/BaiF CoA-transferase family protein [Burkholderiaceae bacterium]
MSAAIGWLPRNVHARAPLAGVRVLDFSELLPGPFLTQCLVELGADVLKVERPPVGDPVRRSSPALFAAINRGKRSMLANLKEAHDHAVVLSLAHEADVLIESFRPGVFDRLGLGYAALSARNERLVQLSLSGYGAGGPREQWPGHDINYLATAGVVAMAIAGGADGAPPSFGVPMADLNAAVYALAALNAALLQRERTGRGQHLDVSITDCALHWMNARLPVLRQGADTDAGAQRTRVLQRPGYGVFRCRDGVLITVAALEDHFWAALVRTLDLHAYAGDAHSRYRDRAADVVAINAAVAAALAALDSTDAMARLLQADVPVSEVAAPETLHE